MDALDPRPFGLQRDRERLLKSVETDVIIQEESVVFGKHFLHLATSEIEVLVGVVIAVEFGDKDRPPIVDAREIRVKSQRVIECSRPELEVPRRLVRNRLVHVEPHPISLAEILLRTAGRIAVSPNAIRPVAEIAA